MFAIFISFQFDSTLKTINLVNEKKAIMLLNEKQSI